MNYRKTLLLLSLIVALVLSGCSGTPSEGLAESDDSQTGIAQGETESGDSPARNIENENGIQLQQLLAVGSVRLDDTDYAISPEQAGTQLLLWKTLASLTGADNVTSEEIDSIYAQIQETLTIDQISAINAMDLTFEDMSETFPDLAFGQAGGFGDLTPEELATVQAQRESGDFAPPEGFTPGQGGPGGGQGFGGGQAPPDGVIPGADNGDGEGRPGGDLGRFGTELIDEIIIFLEERSAQ